MPLLGVVTLVHIEDQLAGVHGLDESLKLAIVRVRRIWHLEIERQILVVLIIPACQNDEDGRFFSVTLVDANKVIDG